MTTDLSASLVVLATMLARVISKMPHVMPFVISTAHPPRTSPPRRIPKRVVLAISILILVVAAVAARARVVAVAVAVATVKQKPSLLKLTTAPGAAGAVVISEMTSKKRSEMNFPAMPVLAVVAAVAE